MSPEVKASRIRSKLGRENIFPLVAFNCSACNGDSTAPSAARPSLSSSIGKNKVAGKISFYRGGRRLLIRSEIMSSTSILDASRRSAFPCRSIFRLTRGAIFVKKISGFLLNGHGDAYRGEKRTGRMPEGTLTRLIERRLPRKRKHPRSAWLSHPR